MFRFAVAVISLVTFSTLSFSAEETKAGSSSLTTTSRVTDKIKVRYWGNYSGPQIASPGSRYTTDFWGHTNTTGQNADDNLTAGYQITPKIRPGIGMPFNFFPTNNTEKSPRSFIEIKHIYVGLISAELYKDDELMITTDARVYTPIGELAQRQDVQTGFRTSQFTTYHIPHSNWKLGLSNYIRYWKYGSNGKGFRNDFELYASPFANYKINSSFDFTLWSDVLQLGHQFGTPWGLKNLPVDIQPGIRWNITSSFNVNPYLNLIPWNLRGDNINIGLVVNAALL